jgi:hypothetical protein
MISTLLSLLVSLAPNPVEIEVATLYGIRSLDQAQLLYKIAEKQLEDIEWYWEQSGDPRWFRLWSSAKYKRLVFGELRYALDRQWGLTWQEHHLNRLQTLLADTPLPSPYVGD